MLSRQKVSQIILAGLMWSLCTTFCYIWQEKMRFETEVSQQHTGVKVRKVNSIKQFHVTDKILISRMLKDRGRRAKNSQEQLGAGGQEDEVLQLEDVFISVKTSGKFHATRLQVVLRTWWNDCKNQTIFFTDMDDEDLKSRTGGRVINTKCGDSHVRTHLCCKMDREYDAFIRSGKKWWCHFDDDNYVNVDALVNVLRGYDWQKNFYIGKPSLQFPLAVNYFGETQSFWFATGGAGLCISKSLGEKMLPWSGEGKFSETCNAIKLPDDCTLGFIINNRLGIDLTAREDFNSHLQTLAKIPVQTLSSQVTLSHAADQGIPNVLNVPEDLVFTLPKDPTRLLSVYCLMHSEIEWCPHKLLTE